MSVWKTRSYITAILMRNFVFSPESKLNAHHNRCCVHTTMAVYKWNTSIVTYMYSYICLPICSCFPPLEQCISNLRYNKNASNTIFHNELLIFIHVSLLALFYVLLEFFLFLFLQVFISLRYKCLVLIKFFYLCYF